MGMVQCLQEVEALQQRIVEAEEREAQAQQRLLEVCLACHAMLLMGSGLVCVGGASEIRPGISGCDVVDQRKNLCCANT